MNKSQIKRGRGDWITTEGSSDYVKRGIKYQIEYLSTYVAND
jgi:hypothetical protein